LRDGSLSTRSSDSAHGKNECRAEITFERVAALLWRHRLRKRRRSSVVSSPIRASGIVLGQLDAFGAVLKSIDDDVTALLDTNPEFFTFSAVSEGMVEIRDFQTTGVVAFARGCPLCALPTGRLEVMGHRIQVNEPYKVQCVQAVDDLVAKL
jgi:hypothetical protein